MLRLSLAFLACARTTQAQIASPLPQANRPNVIIILADDLGYSDLGCFGGEARTPNLDALAADGARFTNFFSESRCCPTRAALLTGLYPQQAGVGHMNEKASLPAYAGALKPTAPTIAEVLKTAGFRTACFGKWHVSNTLQRPDHMKDLNRQRFPEFFSPIEQYPTRRGFDVYWGALWGVVNFYNPFSLVDGERPVTDLPDNFYITDAINKHAAQFVQQSRGSDQPFFMYIAHNAPHWPLMAPAGTIQKYRNQYTEGYQATHAARYQRMSDMKIVDPKNTELSPTIDVAARDKLSPEEKRFEAALFQAHAAMIDRMDQGLGKVFQALKEAGKWDNTLIFVLSDNGASPERYEDAGYDRPSLARDGKPINYSYKDLTKLAGDEHTFFYIGQHWANVANTPYRKFKASQYNGGARTPMIVHWPAGLKVERGGFVRARGHVIDLMATALDIASAKMPQTFAGQTPHPLQGVSLLPLIQGQSSIENYPPLFGEHEGGRSVTTPEGWKLMRDRGENDWHLYNLNDDESELHDVIAHNADRAAKMQAMWNRWAEENQVLPNHERGTK
ncbi:MAG: arylsulfatase [Anaerolineae bacterium]|nr:arylsulfatase [Phycisphaerae bacterium]